MAIGATLEAFLDMLAAGRSLRALVVTNHRWTDMGTPQAYQAAVLEYMAPRAFQLAFPDWSGEAIQDNYTHWHPEHFEEQRKMLDELYD